MTDEPINPTDKWTVRTFAEPAGAGSAKVRIALHNVAYGELPAFDFIVDWAPGAELADAEATGALLAGQSAFFLSQALIAQSVELKASGQPSRNRIR